MKEMSQHKNMSCKKQHISLISKSQKSFFYYYGNRNKAYYGKCYDFCYILTGFYFVWHNFIDLCFISGNMGLLHFFQSWKKSYLFLLLLLYEYRT